MSPRPKRVPIAPIPVADPRAQYFAQRTMIDSAIRRVLERGRYILGEEVRAFESEFATYIGVRHAIGVASGTDAIQLALRALGVGCGDEVISVSHTAVATIAAIELTGARPVLVDIELDSMGLDPACLGAAITDHTRAIVPVHVYGHPVDLGPILAIARARGVAVVEDCAQAHGARYAGRRVGAWGHAGCFSFYPTKNLGALGDGGMVVTDDADLAARVRRLREYGWVERFVSEEPGLNSRLDEIQAAVLRVKLRHLDRDNARRARLALVYREGLTGLDLLVPRPRPGVDHVYHLYVVRSRRRDALARQLAAHGIGSAIHYPVPIHRQPAYRDRLRLPAGLPRTEEAAAQVLSLPLHPRLGADALGAVIDVLRRAG